MSYEGRKIDLFWIDLRIYVAENMKENILMDMSDVYSLYYRQQIWKKVFAKMRESILNSKKEFLDFSDYVHDIPKGIYKW